MKLILHSILILVLSLQPLNMALGTERIDALLEADAMESLERIAQQKLEIKEHKKTLKEVERKLKKAKKGKAVYVQVRNIGGTFIIIAIVVGTYKAHFPIGMRLLLGAYFSMSEAGEGLIKLNQRDVQQITQGLIRTQTKIELLEKNLNKQIGQFCLEDIRHQLCY